MENKIQNSKVGFIIVPMWIITIIWILFFAGVALISISHQQDYGQGLGLGILLLILTAAILFAVWNIHRGLKNNKKWAYFSALIFHLLFSIASNFYFIIFTGFGLYGLLSKCTRDEFGF